MKVITDIRVTLWSVAVLFDMYDDESAIDSDVFTDPCEALAYANGIIRTFAKEHAIDMEEHGWNGYTQFQLAKLSDTVMCEDESSNRLFIKIKTVTL